MKDDETLQELAAQLKQPNGDKGIAIAHMMNETNINMTLQAINGLGIRDYDRILELGHGNAGHLNYLFAQAQQLRYQGLEISPLMQAEAQTLNDTWQRQATFTLYDGITLPFPDQSFDKIFTVNTIYFWSQPAFLVAEIYRVLQPGGTCCITFAQATFMEQLPFTRFGFTLYTTDAVVQLVQHTAFRVKDILQATEQVMSKTGDSVTRDFTTLVLTKPIS